MESKKPIKDEEKIGMEIKTANIIVYVVLLSSIFMEEDRKEYEKTFSNQTSAENYCKEHNTQSLERIGYKYIWHKTEIYE